MASEVIVKADKIKKRNNIFKILKLGLTILFVVLIFAFIILSVVYKGGKFTISLDSRLANDSKIVIYEDNVIKEGQRKLSARDIEFMDNISIDWIPKDIDNYNGSHNGENYIAYTFYIENEGKEIINYWYSIIIDDVIKNVDEASRVMVYLNGEKTIYAKLNSYTGKEETDTKAFFDKKTAVLEQRKDFSPGMIDKFTIVIWLEGDDPDCTDNLLGGEIKMHMEIRGEYKDGEE